MAFYEDPARAYDEAEEHEAWIDSAWEPIDSADVLQALVDDGTLSDAKITELVRQQTLQRVRARPEPARKLIVEMGRLIDAVDDSLDYSDRTRTALANARQASRQIGGPLTMTCHAAINAARAVDLPVAWRAA